MEDLLELLVGGVSKRMEILDYEFTIVAYVEKNKCALIIVPFILTSFLCLN